MPKQEFEKAPPIWVRLTEYADNKFREICRKRKWTLTHAIEIAVDEFLQKREKRK